MSLTRQPSFSRPSEQPIVINATQNNSCNMNICLRIASNCLLICGKITSLAAPGDFR
jgi:hypothetical protein